MQKLALVFDDKNNAIAGLLQDDAFYTCRVIQTKTVRQLSHKATTLFAADIINRALNLSKELEYKSVYLLEEFTDQVMVIFILTNDNNGYVVNEVNSFPVTLQGRMPSRNGIIWNCESETSRVNREILEAIDDDNENRKINEELCNIK